MSEQIQEVTEKRPLRGAWLGPFPMPAGATRAEGSLRISRWVNGATVVVSELAVAHLPRGDGSGPQWHLSVSVGGRRARGHEVRQVLQEFGFPRDAEEDNHHPGLARHFWEPLDPAARALCQCKDDETVIREADGYTWTNPKDPAEGCRGCEYAREFGRPCPLHGPAAAPAARSTERSMSQAEAERERLMSNDLDQDLLALPEGIRTGRVDFLDGSALVMKADGCCPGWWPATDPHVTGEWQQVPRLSQVARNALDDPRYCPYCMRCTRAVRMERIEPFFWGHHCGARHDERAEVAAYLAVHRQDNEHSLKENP